MRVATGAYRQTGKNRFRGSQLPLHRHVTGRYRVCIACLCLTGRRIRCSLRSRSRCGGSGSPGHGLGGTRWITGWAARRVWRKSRQRVSAGRRGCMRVHEYREGRM